MKDKTYICFHSSKIIHTVSYVLFLIRSKSAGDAFRNELTALERLNSINGMNFVLKI